MFIMTESIFLTFHLCCSVKLRIKTGSSQFTPSSNHSQEMLDQLQEAEAEENGGMAEGDKGPMVRETGAVEMDAAGT